MRPRTWSVFLLTFAYTWPSHAAPRHTRRHHEESTSAAAISPSVQVQVVEIAGNRAYVSPGRQAGLRPGSIVSFRGHEFPIRAATEHYAVIELRETKLRVRDQGTAKTAHADESIVQARPVVRPLANFRGQWPRVTRPAETQHPRHVPIGAIAGNERTHLMLWQTAGGIVSLNASRPTIARSETGVRLRTEPFDNLPFGINADTAVQVWLANDLQSRDGARSRPMLRVRELELRYGDRQSVHAALGRLRYGTSTAGIIDGLRAQSPAVNGWKVAAFGGGVPDPGNGSPSLDASRFGAEIVYSNLDTSWRPSLNLVGQGSLFDGEIDERRIQASIDVFPGDARLSGHAQVSMLGSGNPWNRPVMELTAANVDGSLRLGAFQVGARLDMRKPERSRWLNSLLPLSWLCRTVPSTPTDPPLPDQCDGSDDSRYMGSLHAGLELGQVSLSATGNAIHIAGADELDQLAGMLQFRLLQLWQIARLELGVFGSRSALLETVSAHAALGVLLLREALDVSVHYRPAWLSYRASEDELGQHQLGADILWLLSDHLDLIASVDAMAGGDVDALTFLSSLVWRPFL